MFGRLIYALHRRTNDKMFLPTVTAISADRNILYGDIAEKVIKLAKAIAGTNIDHTRSKRQGSHPLQEHEDLQYAPALPPLLQERLVFALTGMQTEAVEMGKSIELNTFRRIRRDPRVRTEEDLAAWRKDAYMRWNTLVDGLLAEVDAFWRSERRKSGSRL